MKEIEIGNKFKCLGRKFKCVEDNTYESSNNCKEHCALYCDILCEFMACNTDEREDGKYVHFEEVNL